MKRFIYIPIVLFLLISCVSPSKDGKRRPSSVDGNVKVPEGFNRAEEDRFWHLSEGADIYPYAWAKNLINLNRNERSPYLKDMDQKYNMISDYNTNYIVPYIGMSVAWSGKRDLSANVLKNDSNYSKIMSHIDVGGSKSIAMMGTNCSLCHTNVIKYNGKNRLIEGGGAILNPRGLFKDMAASTVKMMIDPEELTRFLLKFNYGEEEAKQAACGLVESIAFETGIKKIKPKANCKQKISIKYVDRHKEAEAKYDGILGHLPTVKARNWSKAKYRELYNNGKVKVGIKAKDALAKNDRKILRYHLEELLLLTVLRNGTQKGSRSDLNDELKARMDWFSKLALSYPPAKEGHAGYARTDAFGRIGNTVARMYDPVPLTANVSLPSIWGVKYRDLFHYNANTNSVLMRNIGQSFGLGAVLIKNYAKDEVRPNNEAGFKVGSYRATTNIPGLVQLENLMYKIKVPQWTKIMGDDIDKMKVIPGCNVYLKNCVGCHSSDERVGPSGELIKYKTFALNKPGMRTDPNQAVMQAKLIRNPHSPLAALKNGIPLKEALFKFTQNVRDQYLYDNPGARDPQEPDKLLAMRQSRELRGIEEFRDPYLGEDKAQMSYVNFTDVSGNKLENKGVATGYSARHLAGVWSSPPYLHNGSVVSIMELLTHPSLRKKQFDVATTDYDRRTLGYKPRFSDQTLAQRCKTHEDECFISEDESHHTNFYKKLDDFVSGKSNKLPGVADATGDGNSNLGHYMPHWNEMTQQDKVNLIEFLKVLKPTPEYAWQYDDEYYYLEKKPGFNTPTCKPGSKIYKSL